MRYQIMLTLLLFAISGTTLVASDANKNETLLKAVYQDDSAKVSQLLNEKADPNYINRYEVTPLHIACKHGNLEIATMLIKQGASKTQTAKNESPLVTAARSGNTDLVKLLLPKQPKGPSKSSKPSKPSKNLSPAQLALLWAANEGHTQTVDLLIQHSVHPNSKLRSGMTPIMLAAREGHHETVKRLLLEKPDLQNTTGSKGGRFGVTNGTTVLRLAIENGHFDIAITLLDAGANANEMHSGFTPLHMLSWLRKKKRGDNAQGHPMPRQVGELTALGLARLLVEKYGADVNYQLPKNARGGNFNCMIQGATPFYVAAHTADLEYMKLLHALGADPKLATKDGSTPLLATAGIRSQFPEEEASDPEESIAAMSWLLSLGCNINHTNKAGQSAMHGAALKNNPKMVHFLAANNHDVNVWHQKSKGRTPLNHAQGFRPGNFKPCFDTVAAIEEVLRANGITPPPPPSRNTHKRSYGESKKKPKLKTEQLPWVEDFNLPDGAIVDKAAQSKTSWIATRQDGVFEVQNKRLVLNDGDAVAKFHTAPINIAGKPVIVRMDFESKGGVDEGEDYAKLFAVIDGKRKLLFSGWKTSNTESFKSEPLTGKTLVLQIETYATNVKEFYFFDNLSVKRR